MMTVDKRSKGLGPSELGAAGRPETTRYLEWVAERVRGEDFWTAVKEDVIENFASLLNRELPDELWAAAYSQRDGKDYLITFAAVLERLQEYCGRIGKRG